MSKTPLQELTEQTWKLSSPQELLDAGYRCYETGSTVSHPHAKALYQKRLRPSLYCNIWHYAPIGPQTGPQFQAESQISNSRKCVNVELHHNNESIEDIENFFLMQAEWFESKFGSIFGSISGD